MHPRDARLRFPLACLAAVIGPARAADATLVFACNADADSRVSQEILRLAYLKLGYAVRAVELPGERALVMANSGALDGDTCRIAQIEARYRNLIPIAIPVNLAQGVVFTKGAHFTVHGWDSLRPYRIGSRIGLKFAEQGLARLSGASIEMVGTTEKSLQKLAAGHVDVVVEARLSGLWQIHASRLQGIRILEPPLETIALYHYLHQKHAALVPHISAVLQEMQKKGELARLRVELAERYIGHG